MYKYAIISLLVALLISIPAKSQGQKRIIQGKVIKHSNQKKRPFNSIPVTLYKPSEKSRSNPSITDFYGNYYFYNVPEGTYQLEIWPSGKIDEKNPQDAAKVHQITINYDEATSKNDHILLKLDPITISP